MKTYIYTIIALMSFVSCNNKAIITETNNTIDNKYYLEDIAKSWHAIFLDESSIDAIVGEITKVLYDDGLYFVSHHPNVASTDIIISVFNQNGEYLRRISHIGRAKNEYLNLGEWDLNINDNEVIIFDSFNSKLLRYSYMNEFIGSYQLDSSFEQMSKLFIVNSSTFLIQMSIIPEGINDLFLYNTNKKHEQLFQKRNIKTDNFILTPMENHFSHSNSTNYFARYFDNNIYSIDSTGNVNHYINIDFIPTYKKTELKLLSLDNENRPRSYISNIYNFNDYLLIDCRSDKLLLNKSDKTITIYKPHKFVGEKIPLNQHIICSYNNCMVGYLDNVVAQNYLDIINENTPPEIEEFYKKAAENENATLVFYEIKMD